ncbi:MAG: hypothetical protein EPN36_13970 [Rhodanobacteraceae bacterium]|nr:MAG: hypothetical protein EPN36_13970 [Rhodanobacteraceae bacterium]
MVKKFRITLKDDSIVDVVADRAEINGFGDLVFFGAASGGNLEVTPVALAFGHGHWVEFHDRDSAVTRSSPAGYPH